MDDKAVVPGGYSGGDVPSPYTEDVPENLRRATGRLQFPPSYVVVGFYRLITDRNLRVPAWQKCKHGFVRGATVGLLWVSTGYHIRRPERAPNCSHAHRLQAAGTYKIQKVFVEYFLIK